MKCFFVPGLLGSELHLVGDGDPLLWVDYLRLSLGQAGAMRLDPSGLGPGSPDGALLRFGDPLPAYYGLALDQLGRQLGQAGAELEQQGYDWRMRLIPRGGLLANRIRAEVTSTDPCVIVGHSMGGLVARSAWSSLAFTGETNLVKRIITMGTPHWGSYSILTTWMGTENSLKQLSYLSLAAMPLAASSDPLTVPHFWTVDQLVQLTQTWPSFYYLLPTLGAPDADGDPYRSALYTAGLYHTSSAPRQEYLDESRSTFAPWLLSPATTPPAEKMVCVAGTGQRTAEALIGPNFVGRAEGLDYTDAGDGRVTVASATLPHCQAITVDGRHMDLPLNLGLSGDLASLILAPAPSPPPPPPPPAVIAGRFPARLQGPPLPALVGTVGHDC